MHKGEIQDTWIQDSSFWKTQHGRTAYFYCYSSAKSFFCFCVKTRLISHKQQTRYLSNVSYSVNQYFPPETHHTRNADNRLIILHPSKEISKTSETERKKEFKKWLDRKLTLRLVLSLPPDDTLHLFPGLLSTGGDSLSFSACCNFLFRSWNMSWWRFLVCMIFCARVNKDNTNVILYTVLTVRTYSFLQDCRWMQNIKGWLKYLKIQLCVAWFSSLQGVNMKNVRIFNVTVLGFFKYFLYYRKNPQKQYCSGKICTESFTEILAGAYSKQLVTSWPLVSLSQSVWGELDLLLEAATLHCILETCLACGQEKHPGLCGHFAVRSSHCLTFKNVNKNWPLENTYNAEEAYSGCLCYFYLWAIHTELQISWYLIPPKNALDMAWFISKPNDSSVLISKPNDSSVWTCSFSIILIYIKNLHIK